MQAIYASTASDAMLPTGIDNTVADLLCIRIKRVSTQQHFPFNSVLQQECYHRYRVAGHVEHHACRRTCGIVHLRGQEEAECAKGRTLLQNTRVCSNILYSVASRMRPKTSVPAGSLQIVDQPHLKQVGATFRMEELSVLVFLNSCLLCLHHRGV